MGGPAAPPPTAAVTPPAAAAGSSAPVAVAEATVQRLPERLQDVTRPMVLTGTSAGETPEGLTRVRTSAGEVLLKLAVPLPADRPVTLQITPAQTLLGQASTELAGTGQTAQGSPVPGPAVSGSPNPSPATGSQPIPARALVLMQALPSTTSTTTAAPSATAAKANTTPSIILPNPAAASPPAAATLPALLPGTIVPALVLAAAPKAPALPGTQPQPGQATPQQALPPQAPAGQTPSLTEAPAGTPASAAPPPPQTTTTATASPPAPTQPAAAPAGKPMPDTPVELGGDAAHPGAEAPTLKRPATIPAPDLPQGGTVALKILSVTPPPTEPAPATPTPARPAATGSTPTPAKATPESAQPPATPPTATEGSPALPSDIPPDTPEAPLIRGTVAGSTPQGQPILATKQGMLALNVQASLPQGAKVTAALTDPSKALQGAPPPPAEPAPLSERDWPAMRQLLTTLAGMDRALAHTVLSTIMPQPNRKLGAALTFLLSAIRGGDARGWLGEEAASALEKGGQGDLLSQLEREFKGLQKQAGEPLPGDWRPYTLPMMDANGPMPIQLHVHPIDPEEEDGKGAGGGPKGSRFLIDVTLSRLGPMQLDGLVQPNRFDLILRSHTALSPELRLELIQIFADSVRAVGYTGGLSFQSGAKSWVKLTRAGSSHTVTA